MKSEERRIYHLKNIVNSGEGTPLHWDMLTAAQKQMAEKIIEGAANSHIILIQKRQLPFLNYRHFAGSKTLAIRRYRLSIHRENGVFRVEVWKPGCPLYGLSNQPPSRLPKYIKEFIEL